MITHLYWAYPFQLPCQQQSFPRVGPDKWVKEFLLLRRLKSSFLPSLGNLFPELLLGTEKEQFHTAARKTQASCLVLENVAPHLISHPLGCQETNTHRVPSCSTSNPDHMINQLKFVTTSVMLFLFLACVKLITETMGSSWPSGSPRGIGGHKVCLWFRQ